MEPSGDNAIEDVRARVAALPWFHPIDFGQGIVTPGAGWPGYEAVLQAAADICCGMGIEGQSMIDVGAFDGINSAAAERFAAVLEFETPHHGAQRSIFLGIKPDFYPDYIAANIQYARPRFTGRAAA